jgi:hypothetical protein
MESKFPIIGFVSVWPSNRIVKVKVEPCKNEVYPFRVTSLEKGVKIGGSAELGEGWDGYNIVDPSLITLYKSREEGEKAELEKLHDQHLIEKKALKKQEERVKSANRRIAEYKMFKQIQTYE